jgi:hypothetical protein
LDSPRSRSTKVIGHLDDAVAGLPGAPGQVDLEAVAVRGDVVQRQRVEDLAPVGAEAARGVAQRQPERQPGVGVAPAAEQLAAARPVDDLSPRTHRLPSTRSAADSAASRRGSCSGACEPSASISTTTA